jgi:exopolyphosphatase/guanosine-5'-triphosphate,3'-diphosphate pyrophosphatase
VPVQAAQERAPDRQADRAPERKPRGGRVGVIDIGSNSIRLVVYERASRAPVALFNEKVMCGLGRGIESSGKLDADAVERAIANLRRFTALAAAMRVEKLDALATAAVRDAKNGPDFIREVSRACKLQARVLDGEEEARLSGLGVLSAAPEADGAMGDLGGGSLELVELGAGAIGKHVTLPIGPLRVMPAADGSRKKMKDAIEKRVDELEWLEKVQGRNFYPVGGAWRALARVHMEQVNHPLHVIHNYEIKWDEAEEFLQLVSRLSPSSLSKMYGVSRRRHETLPYAALLLIQIARKMKPKRIIFSAFGLREGWLYDALPAAERARDPLLAAAADQAKAIGRFGEDGLMMADWMAALFPNEPPSLARLRRAACLCADIAWLDHPDYRAEHAFNRALRISAVGIDHPGRAYLAAALFARYGGDRDTPQLELTRKLLGKEPLRQAWMAGVAMRLGLTLTGGTPGLLREMTLMRKGGRLSLQPSGNGAEAMIAGLMGEVARRRFDALESFLDESEV